MPELVRNITARLREFLRDRRCARRYNVRLTCHVKFAKAKFAKNGSHGVASIEGHTRDVSSDGLALILPAIRIGDQYLAGENHQLRVRLQLPTQTVEMQAVAVRYDSFADEGLGAGYIVGFRITQLGQEDREHYVDFLHSLGQK